MIPYSTDRELQRTPWATISIIVLCTVIEIICLVNPALRESLALNPEAFRLWQPFTAMFAHADPLHLIGNMLFLWVFGSHAEDAVGIPRYLLIYVTAGLAGDWLQPMADQIFLHHIRGGIGASGAIMGLLALFAIRFRSTKVNFFYWYSYLYSGTFQVPALWVGAIYFVLDLAQGFATGAAHVGSAVGNFAHIGGFICGLGWAYGLRLPAAASVDEQQETAAQFASAGAFEAAGAAMEDALRKDPGNPELWMRAARYYGQKGTTRSRAVPMWASALQLWLRHDDHEAVVAHWPEAIREFPPESFEPDLLTRIGRELEHAGQMEEAIRAYAAAVQNGGEEERHAVTAMHLADLCVARGDVDGGRGWYQFLAQRWPDSREALDVPQRLAKLGDDVDVQLL